jgi:hypothetical protein
MNAIKSSPSLDAASVDYADGTTAATTKIKLSHTAAQSKAVRTDT